jgi:hypothetical protein
MILELVDSWGPTGSYFALGTNGLLLFPVQDKIGCRKAGVFFGLPMVVT